MPTIPEFAITFTTLVVGLLTTGVLVLLPSTWQGDGRALRYWVIGNLSLSLDRAHTLLASMPGGSPPPGWLMPLSAACVATGAAMHVTAMHLLLQPERTRWDWRVPVGLGLVVAVLGWAMNLPVFGLLALMCATTLCILTMLHICWPRVREMRGVAVMTASMAFFLLMNLGGFVELGHMVMAGRSAEVPAAPTTILALDLVLSVVVSLAFLMILIEQLHQRVERLSVTDPLTGVLNRRGFLQAANLQLLHIDRMRFAHRAASVLLMDLDHFKRINDSLGHPMGDAVLCGAAQRVAAAVRKTDLLARWGGEEFVVLLPGTRLSEAREVAERIRQAVALAPLADGAPIVTVSIGAAALEDALAIEQLPALIAEADRRLYLAKRQRNCVMDQDDAPERPLALPAAPMPVRDTPPRPTTVTTA